MARRVYVRQPARPSRYHPGDDPEALESERHRGRDRRTSRPIPARPKSAHPKACACNNPAGHLDPGESPLEGVVRETLEETARPFTPDALVGIYLSRFRRDRPAART